MQHEKAVRDAIKDAVKDALDEVRLIRWTTLASLVGMSKSHIRQLEIDGKFPQRVQLGTGAVAWRFVDVKSGLQIGNRVSLPISPHAWARTRLQLPSVPKDQRAS